MEKAIYGLVGIFLGAMLAMAREFFADWIKRKKNAKYLAIRVSCILDKFIYDCVNVVQDDGLCCGQRNNDGCLEVQVKTPILEFDSLSLEWESLSSGLLYEVINFPNDIKHADSSINSVGEYVASPPDYEEYFEERQTKYAELGLRAFELSKKLHVKYSLPIREYQPWNPLEILTKKKQLIEKTGSKK